MEKFEYKILNISREHLKRESFQSELISTLNRLGENSWELISAEGINESSVMWKAADTTDILFFSKERNYNPAFSSNSYTCLLASPVMALQLQLPPHSLLPSVKYSHFQMGTSCLILSMIKRLAA